MKNYLLFATLSFFVTIASFAQNANQSMQATVISKVTVHIPSGSLMCPHLGRMLKERFPKQEGVSNLVISPDNKYAYFDVNNVRYNSKDSVIMLFKKLGEYPDGQIKEVKFESVNIK